MTDFLHRLKQRKLVQWAVAYAAAAFALLQGVDMVGQKFGWPDSIGRILIIASCVGFLITLVLAWYHGERGAQKVSGTELLLLSLLLVVFAALSKLAMCNCCRCFRNVMPPKWMKVSQLWLLEVELHCFFEFAVRCGLVQRIRLGL